MLNETKERSLLFGHKRWLLHSDIAGIDVENKIDSAMLRIIKPGRAWSICLQYDLFIQSSLQQSFSLHSQQ